MKKSDRICRKRLEIQGIVQGVGFRAYTQVQAKRANLTGWVRNVEDGRVEAEVEGSRHAIEGFVGALEQGPRLSRVDSVEVEWMEYGSLDQDFRIRY